MNASASFSCSICNKSLNSQDYLATHIETVHNKVAQIGKVLKYPCPKCERTFSSERRLANHVSKHDTDQLEHSCQICDKRQVGVWECLSKALNFPGLIHVCLQ